MIQFSGNGGISARARDLLDLTMAMAANETLANGARGGSQSRKEAADNLSQSAWSDLYRNFVASANGRTFSATQSAVPAPYSSNYFPDEVVWNMWSSGVKGSAGASAQNNFESWAAIPGVVFSPDGMDVDPSRSAFRYNFTTPSFVLGSTRLDLNNNYYAEAASESRSLSLVLNEGQTSTMGFSMIPQMLFEPSAAGCFDKSIGLQDKNVMIYQNNIDFFLHGHDSQPAQPNGAPGSGAYYCFGQPAPGFASRTISSERVSNGIAYPLNFTTVENNENVVGEQMPSASSYDATRTAADLVFSSCGTGCSSAPWGFSYDDSRPATGLFFYSHGNSAATPPVPPTFVWIKPVHSDFEVWNGYDENKTIRSAAFYNKEVHLTTDAFSPVTTVVTSAANYGFSFASGNLAQAFARFENEVASTALTPLSYENSQVKFQQSMRSSLQSNDFFFDPSEISHSTWQTVNSASAHDGNYQVATATSTPLVFNFTVPPPPNQRATAKYCMKMRARGLNGSSDSFFVRIDAGVNSFAPTPQATGLTWTDVTLSGASSNCTALHPGAHTLTVSRRETGSQLDASAMLYERNDNPSTVVYSETINRTQPASTINGVATNEIPMSTNYAYYSPFVRSDRNSGLWELSYGNRSLVIDQSAPIASRHSGYRFDAVSAPQAAPIAGSSAGVSFVTLATGSVLTYNLPSIRGGLHHVYLKTRSTAGTNDSLYISVNGGAFVPIRLPSVGTWQWNGAQEQTSSGELGDRVRLQFNTGANVVTIKTREPGAQLSELMIEGL